MAEVKQTKQPARAAAGQAVKFVQSTTAPEEVYVDGVLAVSLRHGVGKIECYRVAGRASAEDPTEVRRHTHRLVLPAVALGELLQILERTKAAVIAAAEKARDTRDPDVLQ